MRASEEEKRAQIASLAAFRARHAEAAEPALRRLQDVARRGDNVFEELMETVKVASLGQISEALFEVGGRYRRALEARVILRRPRNGREPPWQRTGPTSSAGARWSRKSCAGATRTRSARPPRTGCA